MTKDQYIESLRKLNLNLYMFGKKVENPVDDPVIRPSLNLSLIHIFRFGQTLPNRFCIKMRRA